MPHHKPALPGFSLENPAVDKADSTKIYFVFTFEYDEVKWGV
jgi:hypothetical protein